MKTDEELQDEGVGELAEEDMDDFDMDVSDVKGSDNFQGIVDQTSAKWQESEIKAKEQLFKEREESNEVRQQQLQAEANKAHAQQRASHKAQLNEYLLNSSYYNLTQPHDSEKPVNAKPQKALPRIPDYYPSKPLPGLLNAKQFKDVETDVLFFAFYYQQDTYNQYLAARELKMRSWRYHKVLNAWFQRKEKPVETTEDFERGTYVFFDYIRNWRQEVKEDFKFEYCSLEDELQTPPPTTRKPKQDTAAKPPQMPVPTQQ
eukprot:TRINITY_DN5390_c5_g5_i1.p1 TRINITY_DN5390_c5_g5~~TRINITY_DN5390_c5_g5_i1.p1  ORF type:complete len:260 (+),score=65.15 TRINITY_DN5390_c5_g5_i1:107-886(+)